jgi:hypothetical protein
VVDEAVEIELALEGAVPALPRKHGLPVDPKVGRKELVAKHLVDPLVLHALPGSEEQVLDLGARLRPEAKLVVRVRVLPPLLGDAAQRVVRVVLVEPVHLVEHAGPRHLEARDGAEHVPQALHVVLELAPAANHEPVPALDAVECAAGKRVLLEDGDALAGHLGVAHEEHGAREAREARADKVCALALHQRGLARAHERLKVAACVAGGVGRHV